ncbi:hypothetical protein [Sorangium sp. So ce1182]|uniref:hypothetical protein n=1 Tax=Sorangium sp. So ce1182 TaxID=3133334 RepID=UPI003F5FC889
MAESLDFGEMLSSAAAAALPRPQVEAELQRVLRAAPAGMLVVRGEPGSGKTFLIAAQVHSQGGLHHFLRRGHTEYSLWRDPYGFLTSIGFQLRERFGKEIFPSSVAVDVNQRVALLDEGATMVGARIQRLIAVPWSDSKLSVQQRVDQAKGAATGVHVEELVEDYHRIPLVTFREMALIAPLKRLKAEQPGARVVLWVDALDEDAGHPAGESIAGTLPTAEELQALGNLWVVVASRPGPHLDHLLQAGAGLLDLHDPHFTADNRAFARSYVERALSEAKVQAALSAAGQTPAGLAERVLDQAGDNPLYLEQFFNSVRTGGLQSLLAGGWPAGLDAIQVRLLGAIVFAAGESFGRQVAPVLQALAVARRPLTMTQLARFTGLKHAELSATLGWLRPYLNVSGQEPEAFYFLYHRAFQETLTARTHQAERWYVSLPAANDRLSAAYCNGTAINPGALDDYGLDFLSTHLAAGGEASLSRLLELPTPEWRQRRRRAACSNWPFLEDLRRALHAARSLPPEQAVPAASRLSLLAGRVHDAERALPDGALKAMVRLGLLQRALGAVSAEMEGDDQVERLAEIAAGLAAGAPANGVPPDLYWQVLRQGLDVLKRNPGGFSLAALLETCPTGSFGALPPLLEQAVDLLRQLPADWQRPRAVIEVARLLGGVDGQAARHTFQVALADCLQLLRSSLPMEQARLMRCWAAFDPPAAASALSRLKLSSDPYSARAVLAVGRALQATRHASALRDLTDQVESKLVAAAQDPFERALCEVELGLARLELGDRAAALASLERSRQAAAMVGDPQDPNQVHNRKAMGVDAWIAAAHLAVELEHPDAQDLLETAWNGYAAHDWFNGGRSQNGLAALQLRLEPGLLEVYLDQVAVDERQARIRLKAVDALLDLPPDPDRQKVARRWLDTALETAERAAPAASAGPFHYAAALAFLPDGRAAGLEVVRQCLQSDEETAFRLEALRRMPPGDPGAPAWLEETVQAWFRADDEHYLAHFPAALARLPSGWAQVLLANLPEPPDPLKRCYLELALCALAERQTPGSGLARLDAALAAIPQAATARTPAALLLAFAAGLWWELSPGRAASLWNEAQAWLDTVEQLREAPDTRHFWLMCLTRTLELGAPQAALPVYLASPEPPLAPGTLTMFVPGVLVELPLQAGLGQRDYHLGAAAGVALAVGGGSLINEASLDLLPPAARAVALAASARGGSPARRMQRAEAALQAAAQVQPDFLGRLLYSRGIAALSALGAHQRVLERLRPAAQAVISRLPVYGTQPGAGYAGALGGFAAALLRAGECNEALELLFVASRLGGGGVYLALGEICEAVAERGGLDALVRECR